MNGLAPDELAGFRAGDGAVFRRVIESFTPRLMALVAPFARDADEAHDLAQDTWHRVYEKRAQFTGMGSLGGWIAAVARRVCLNAVRSQRAAVGRPGMGTIGDAPPGPDHQTEGAALRRALHLAVMELPPRERDVVWLRFIEERSTRETAAAMACAEGTVKATLHHALGKLRTTLKGWAP